MNAFLCPCFSLNAFSIRSMEKSHTKLQAEMMDLRTKVQEEQKKRENQDALVRRLQKRVLLLTKVRYYSKPWTCA